MLEREDFTWLGKEVSEVSRDYFNFVCQTEAEYLNEGAKQQGLEIYFSSEPIPRYTIRVGPQGEEYGTDYAHLEYFPEIKAWHTVWNYQVLGTNVLMTMAELFASVHSVETDYDGN